MTHPGSAAPTPHRLEIQTLRAVAVGLVVLFHLWPNRLTGGYVGVDVFFVISGFLITGHLVRELDRDGTIDLVRFWARRVRRLLPAAVLVLLVSLVGVLVLLPVPAWRDALFQFWSSLAIVQNWTLAANSVDYFAVDSHVSPFLHYWSLSVEEQFYLVWPLLALAAAALGRRLSRRGARDAFLLIAIAVLVLGLGYSIWSSLATPEIGYYATPAHAWEFAAGGIAALTVGTAARTAATKAGAHAAGAATLIGLALIVVTALLFDAETPFPGWVAVFPVAGTLLVILSGPALRGPVATAMALRPVVAIGDLSYALYLWHWPLIVFAPFVLDRPLGTVDKIGLLAASIALAWLTKHLVEDRARSGRLARRFPLRSAVAGLAAAALAAGIGVLPFTVFSVQRAEAVDTSASIMSELVTRGDPCFGAAAARNEPRCPEMHVLDPRLAAVTPWLTELESAQTDVTQTSWSECPTSHGGVLKPCVYGPDDADLTIGIAGDSHGFQWAHAILVAAQERNWRVEINWMAGCPIAAGDLDIPEPVEHESSDSCRNWSAAAIDWLAHDPDIDVAVVSSFGHKYAGAGRADVLPVMTEAFGSGIDTMLDAGRRVVVVADNPYPQRHIPQCIAESGTVDNPCTTPRDIAVLADPLEDAATARLAEPGLQLLDFTDMLCDEEQCFSVIGGVPAYNDAHHLSRLFLQTLAPEFAEALDPAR